MKKRRQITALQSSHADTTPNTSVTQAAGSGTAATAHSENEVNPLAEIANGQKGGRVVSTALDEKARTQIVRSHILALRRKLPCSIKLVRSAAATVTANIEVQNRVDSAAVRERSRSAGADKFTGGRQFSRAAERVGAADAGTVLDSQTDNLICSTQLCKDTAARVTDVLGGGSQFPGSAVGDHSGRKIQSVAASAGRRHSGSSAILDPRVIPRCWNGPAPVRRVRPVTRKARRSVPISVGCRQRACRERKNRNDEDKRQQARSHSARTAAVAGGSHDRTSNAATSKVERPEQTPRPRYGY
jgi:hypothetical protein